MHEEQESRLSHAMFSTAHRTFSRWQKLLLLASALLAFAAAYLAFYTVDGAIRGYSASLLQHGSPLRGVLSAIIAVAVSAVVGTVIAGRVRPDAGLFAAAATLLVFRFQGGGSRYTLLVADGRSAFSLMALETLLLAAILLGVFIALRSLVIRTTLADDAARDGCALAAESLDQKLLCSATVAVVMTAGMMILCQSDRPGQVLWAVLLSSLAATWCAFRFIPLAPSVWYWIGPLSAGAIGYVNAYFYGFQNAAIGEPAGMLAALARPTPLDYASVGVIGSLIGYWIGRKQHREREERAEAEAADSSHVGTG